MVNSSSSLLLIKEKSSFVEGILKGEGAITDPSNHCVVCKVSRNTIRKNTRVEGFVFIHDGFKKVVETGMRVSRFSPFKKNRNVVRP